LSAADVRGRSYAHGTATRPLLGETIGENLERTVAAHRDRDALVVVHQDVRWSYGELNQRVDQLALGLLAAGVAAGERVGIWAPNCAEWVLVQFATAKVGAILVNINPAYGTAELEHALRQSGCRVLIAARGFRSSDYAAMIDAVRPALASLERVVLLETAQWDELLRAAGGVGDRELRTRIGELDFDDPINIQYTSGTTGVPKGATLSHHNILNNAYSVAEACRYSERDRVCLPVPFYHCFGMVMGNLGAITHGAAIVVPSAAFDPVSVLETVAREACTSLYGVPTMFIAELEQPSFSDHDLRSLRTGIMAGAPCPVDVMRRVIDDMHMVEVTICYGMTETSPVSTQTGAEDPLDKRVGTVGRVGPHLEVKLVDPRSGRTVRRGEPGELLTRGYSVMLGYWDQPERTAEAIDAAGWMHTGDLATMDEEGYLNIVGRIKDMVIRGGENVYPREIEEFLRGHPDILDVAVIGVPDARYGEELMAWVRLRPDATLDADRLRAFCEGRISRFKIPRYVRVADELPMTVTGKIQKFRMREIAIAELGLEHEGRRTA
jgi:fatty-acyl-CoA synthase